MTNIIVEYIVMFYSLTLHNQQRSLRSSAYTKQGPWVINQSDEDNPPSTHGQVEDNFLQVFLLRHRWYDYYLKERANINNGKTTHIGNWATCVIICDFTFYSNLMKSSTHSQAFERNIWQKWRVQDRHCPYSTTICGQSLKQMWKWT